MDRGARLDAKVSAANIDRGTVVLVELDPTIGQERRGMRPCIVVSDATVNAAPRFALIAVIPVTGTPGIGALYPKLSAGESGLSKDSYALVDQLRSVDKRRIRRVFGSVTAAELGAVDEGMRMFLGLASRT